MKNIVYYDLETQRSMSDVGGSNYKDQLKVSVGVAYSTKTGKYHIFGEDGMQELIEMLLEADLVVGYNHIDFDYKVLHGYTIMELEPQTRNLDMMVDIQQKIGFRLKLDSIAAATLGTGKTADGLDALRWWKEYKETGEQEPLMKIAEYCAYDVKVTRFVHEYGMEHGKVMYDDKAGGIAEVEVDW